MIAADVLELARALEREELGFWVDGGWGVDALLGEQTRAHRDLDLVMKVADVPRLRKLLADRAYVPKVRDDDRDWNFVLSDDLGHEIDVHVIALDAEGNGIYGPSELGLMYPAESLKWTGSIGGATVPCISPEFQVASHSGYDLKQKDLDDVAALCDRFGIHRPDSAR
jgi:lincosamide nucleotidyltransferase A/C/D/E